MNLKVEVNGKIYETLVQGNTFSDEFSETLDSGTIIINHVEKMDIDVFDDVFIFNEDKTFNKHLLVDQFSEERLNFTDNIYNYKIQLFSETKGLETVQLPNISITQPLDIKEKTSAYKHLCRFVDLYSPKIKVVDDKKFETWKFEKKYIVDPELENVFGNIYTPDFTLNNPNLRDVLSKIMIIKDMIPVVKNGVIYGMDLSKRVGEFDINKGDVSYITSSKTSSNYCDNLKTTYINALSQEKTCKMVEYLGFRNSDVALMKISDLRLETRFPIYKINKIYMCYYKKVYLKNPRNTNSEIVYPEETTNAFLCKQDITPLVKLNSERNYLSLDWDDFESKNPPRNIEELSKYRMATVGYDIGSNKITGWGEMYTFPKFVWDINKTYVENIFRMVDNFTPYGIYNFDYFKENINAGGYSISMSNGDLKSIVTPFGLQDTTFLDGTALKLKSFFFIVEYEGFYNGTVIHSKDAAKGTITINDNQSSSLTLLEADGIAQKEKINRFGNKGYVIPVRYKDFKDLQPLGSVLNNFGGENDIVIYHREYSVFDNEILCTYYGMKDYVLKNYFTSVYAKHRPYNLMSYGESIRRSENKRKILLLSKDEFYLDGEDEVLPFSEEGFMPKLFSAFKESQRPEKIDDFVYPDKINYGYMTAKVPIYDEDDNFTGEYTDEEKMYASDINSFVSGNSLCFNISMYDNVSSGVYISKKQPFDETDANFASFAKDYLGFTKSEYSGSKQSWHMMVNPITGGIDEMGFYVGHIDTSKSFLDVVIDETEINAINDIYDNKLLKLPLIENQNYLNERSNIIGNKYKVNKDNKEIMDMTFQYEIVSNDDDVIITPWLLKLSDFYGEYNKWDKSFVVQDYVGSRVNVITSQWSSNVIGNDAFPWVILSVYTTSVKDLYVGMKLDFEVNFDTIANIAGEDNTGWIPSNTKEKSWSFAAKEIKEIHYYVDKNGVVDNNIISYITLLGTQKVKYDAGMLIGDGPIETSTIDNAKLTLFNLDIWSKSTQYSRNEMFQIYYKRDPKFVWFSNVYFPNISTAEFDPFVYYDGDNKEVFGGGFVYTDKGKTRVGVDYINGSHSNELFSEDNANFYYLKDIVTSDGKPFDDLGKKEYPKNMFVTYSKNKFQKHSAYDEFKYSELEVSNKKVSDCFDILKENNEKYYINIPSSALKSDYSSIQFWFLDDIKNSMDEPIDYSNASYHLVFAANYTEEDIEKGLKIYISDLYSFDQNVFSSREKHLSGKILNLVNDKDNVSILYEPNVQLDRLTTKVILPKEFCDEVFNCGISRQNIKINMYPMTGLSYEYLLNADAVLQTEENNNISLTIIGSAGQGGSWYPTKLIFEKNENGDYVWEIERGKVFNIQFPKFKVYIKDKIYYGENQFSLKY